VGRIRTAKTLGTRHDLNYFKYFGGFKLWRLILCVAVVAVALVWLGFGYARKKQAMYSKGPLSHAHSFFADRCSLCHASIVNGVKTAGFRKTVSDEACLTCHQAPAHHANQLFTPSCSSCHVEHQGLMRLVRVEDRQCVQCHSDLGTKDGHPGFVTDIRGFNRNHPEFVPLRDGFKNPSTIAFNHAAHMGDSIMGPSGRVKLECSDCHRPAAEAGGPWKYADLHLQLAAATASGPGEVMHPDAGYELMTPTSYEKNCASCHKLQFDEHFAESVPHQKPEIVHAFLLQKFQDYISKNPDAIHDAWLPTRKVPEIIQLPPPKNADEWVAQRVGQSEQLLWLSTCKHCHQLDFSAQPTAANSPALPVVKPSALTYRWMPNAIFSHQAHSSVSCESCHAFATASQKGSDVLMPSIKTCQSCHNGNPAKVGEAENSCFLCHQYHDWKQRGNFHSTYTIQEITGESPPEPSHADELSGGK